ncbi:MAG: alkaline phosphatase family protein [Bacteroidales bacterium]|nr:alkaline phosphatase family protein [Bacteroidales bacterium]
MINKLKILFLICAMFIAQTVKAQQSNTSLCSEKPKLVLILLIDNLNNEQLEIIRTRCGNDGFNRIINHGSQFLNAYYDAGGNYSGKNLATLFTGAPAATHGIVSETWIDHLTNKKIHAVYGENYQKNDTNRMPQNGLLLCSTIGNEIRKIYNRHAKIMSIGFDPQKLMWASGVRTAEPTFWFNTRNGEMTYVGYSPDSTNNWIADFNNKRMPDVFITKYWAPKADISTYHEWQYFNSGSQQRTFYYPLQNQNPRRDKYSLIPGSPSGNNMIRDFAAWAIVNEGLGKDDIPDLLTVEFSATPSCGLKRQPLDAETEDLLMCLDENIASMLKVIDANIGMDNTLVVLTAAQGCYDVAHTDSDQWKSRGTVSLRRTTALLNLYLMALHGQGQWVRNYSSGAIYLDRNVANELKANWDSLLYETTDFLHQVAGIGNAIAAKNLTSIYSDSPIIDVLRRNYNPKRSGDILITLEPGWAEEQDDGSQLTQLWGKESVPLAFYGWKVPRETFLENHSMTDVAPTICSFIRVNAPNGCSGTLLPIVK